MMPPDAGKLFKEEIERLRGLVSGTGSKLMSNRIALDKLQTENRHLTASHQNFEFSLKEKHQILFGLETRETELSANCSSLDYLKGQIQVGLTMSNLFNLFIYIFHSVIGNEN